MQGALSIVCCDAQPQAGSWKGCSHKQPVGQVLCYKLVRSGTWMFVGGVGSQ